MNAAVESVMSVLEGVSSLPRAKFEPVLYRKYSREAVLHLLSWPVARFDGARENEIFSGENCYGKSVRAGKAGLSSTGSSIRPSAPPNASAPRPRYRKTPVDRVYRDRGSRKIFDDLSRQRALVGAGEMGELIRSTSRSSVSATSPSPTARSPTRSASPGGQPRGASSARRHRFRGAGGGHRHSVGVLPKYIT